MATNPDDVLRISDLRNADLIVDAIYEGGRKGNAGDDPLHPLLGVSNQGGFRIFGKKSEPRLIVLTTSLADPDWPDALDDETGRFTYYGDNKKPGADLHDTGRFGNHLLKLVFERAHSGLEGRFSVPPLLIFASAGAYRDVRFIGYAVPGAEGLPQTEDLVAVWKSSRGRRFQNYRAVFTVLNISRLQRGWLNALRDNTPVAVPEAAQIWRQTGTFQALKAQRTLTYRTPNEQLPQSEAHKFIVSSVFSKFKDEPVRFERCAGRICEMLLEKVTHIEVTRPSRDGGRDAVGKYLVGTSANGVEVEFALEAKCYSAEHSVGVRELSRLISRLRHRQFGVLVTTSYVGTQAYQEIKDDKHPIVIVSGRDIAEILEKNGLAGKVELTSWLSQF